jgi:hypothetical protein
MPTLQDTFFKTHSPCARLAANERGGGMPRRVNVSLVHASSDDSDATIIMTTSLTMDRRANHRAVTTELHEITDKLKFVL